MTRLSRDDSHVSGNCLKTVLLIADLSLLMYNRLAEAL